MFADGYIEGNKTKSSVAIYTQPSGKNEIYQFLNIGTKHHDGTYHPSNMMATWTDDTSPDGVFDTANTEGPVSYQTEGTYTDNELTNEVEADATKGHENRPPYYVLAYIMRVKF